MTSVFTDLTAFYVCVAAFQAQELAALGVAADVFFYGVAAEFTVFYTSVGFFNWADVARLKMVEARLSF